MCSARMKRLSVVIASHNYERFVGAAIESALALRWSDVEVVVVDDGSTDGSRAVIQRYADRIKVLYTENSSQRVAANHGYAMTTGDVIIFLDADDVLPPELPERLATESATSDRTVHAIESEARAARRPARRGQRGDHCPSRR